MMLIQQPTLANQRNRKSSDLRSEDWQHIHAASKETALAIAEREESQLIKFSFQNPTSTMHTRIPIDSSQATLQPWRIGAACHSLSQ